MRQFSLLFDKTIVIWIVVFLLLQVYLSNQLVNHAKKVDEIDTARRIILEENEVLTHELATLTSLISITERAQHLGLVTTKDVLTVSPDTYTVALQATH